MSAGLSEDVRLGLSVAAASRERASRPRALVLASLLVLVIAVVAAGAGLASRAKARRELANWTQIDAQSEALAKEYAELDSRARAAGEQQTGRRIPDLFSKMEALATRAGMKDKPLPPRETTSPSRAGVTIRETTYENLRDPSIKAMLEWVHLATADPVSRLPGLEVSSLRLQAEQTGWVMRVVFRRWEKP